MKMICQDINNLNNIKCIDSKTIHATCEGMNVEYKIVINTARWKMEMQISSDGHVFHQEENIEEALSFFMDMQNNEWDNRREESEAKSRAIRDNLVGFHIQQEFVKSHAS